MNKKQISKTVWKNMIFKIMKSNQRQNNIERRMPKRRKKRLQIIQRTGLQTAVSYKPNFKSV